MSIARTLRAAGFEALFAGGVVRDLTLGAEIADIDIATSALPADIEKLFPRTVAVGRQFGVMIVVTEWGSFEVATFRTEGAYLDGRHPSAVRFTDAEEDARRRDFTVNALFLDPESRAVIDYVDAAADFERRVIRTVGDPAARLNEDKLRVLRAIRFACSLGFAIEPRTYEEARRQAPQLVHVSWRGSGTN